jgi:hypothetical protein
MSRSDFPDPYERVSWRGVRMDRIDKVAFEVLEDRLNATATIYQGGWNAGGVSASAGAHDGGGAVDYWFPTKDVGPVVRRSRDTGWDAWYRYPPTFPTHVHGIRHGSPTASPVAKGQMTDYVADGNGLVPLGNHDDEMPYRPDPIAAFTKDDYYAELRRRKAEKRLRGALKRIGRDIKHLTRRKAKVRKQLRKLHH